MHAVIPHRQRRTQESGVAGDLLYFERQQREAIEQQQQNQRGDGQGQGHVETGLAVSVQRSPAARATGSFTRHQRHINANQVAFMADDKFVDRLDGGLHVMVRVQVEIKKIAEK